MPASLAIEMGKLDFKEVVDQQVGSNLMHYAAHHGNLKFLRFVHSKGKTEDFQGTDNYGLNLTHYAARMGHLPCLMFIVEKMNCDFSKEDKFGNRPLDLAL